MNLLHSEVRNIQFPNAQHRLKISNLFQCQGKYTNINGTLGDIHETFNISQTIHRHWVTLGISIKCIQIDIRVMHQTLHNIGITLQ